MEREYEYLLHLLGAHLREEPPEPARGINWEKLVQLSQIHCVTGILGYMTMKYPICPEEAMKTSLRSQCLWTIAMFARRAAMAETVAEELEKEGIDHILMKGYVLREDYPIPELRTFGDIDIVIRPQDRRKSHDRMLALGYHVETDWEPVFSYAGDHELYELHTEIMEVDVSSKAGCRAYFQQMWQHTRQVTPHGYRFTPEYHFLYMLTHIAKHIRGAGAGARMYLDVAAFLRHHETEVDWSWVLDQLKLLKLYDFACVVLTAVETWFGIPSPIPCKLAEPGVMADFCTFTMEAGVFGHVGREDGLVSLKAERLPHDQVSRIGTVFHRLFPPAETIENRYTYLQTKPWLLPAAWIHRLVKTRGTWAQHTREVRSILQTDPHEVTRLQRLYDAIGL